MNDVTRMRKQAAEHKEHISQSPPAGTLYQVGARAPGPDILGSYPDLPLNYLCDCRQVSNQSGSQ